MIPALWRRTDVGINALISEGLSSILPYFPDPAAQPEPWVFSIGRQWLAARFQGSTKDANRKGEFEKVVNLSKCHDLQGG